MTLQPGREACPSCGAGRGLATDEQGKSYCFSCSYSSHTKQDAPFMPVASLDLITDFSVKAIPSRMISAETCRRYGYGTGTYKGKPAQFANYYSDTGELIGQKVRTEPKAFCTIGKVQGLWGQSKMRDTGRMVVVTEGELDCLAVSEVLGNRWPVVSLPQGTTSAKKHILASLEWLERFEKVVLCFDQDDSGSKALAECRDLFSPGKVRCVTLPRKDPCEMLLANERDKLVDALYNAPTYTPGGILGGGAILAAALEKPKPIVCQWPWPAIDRMLEGIRYGELITIGAQTGVGKSTVCRELAAHFLKHGETVGYLALEEAPRRTALGIYSVHCDTNLARGRITGIFSNREDADSNWEKHEAKIRAAHEAWGERLYLFDHFGSFDPEALLSRIRYMVVGLGCRVVFLDHLSIMISGLDLDDERKTIDNAMTKLRELVQQTGCLLFLVSHLKRTDSKETNLNQFRGSSSITALSDVTLGIERDPQAEDEEDRDVTLVRLLKNRPIGPLGPADLLKYDHNTGRLVSAEAKPLFKNETNEF